MKNYKSVLFAADLLPEDDNPVAERVANIVQEMHAKVSLIHVVEPMIYNQIMDPTLTSNYVELQTQLEDLAREGLNKLAAQLKVTEENIYLPLGRPADLILHIAEKIGADLIILGSHGRHGLQKLMLGSTANAVLQHAKCDVLAVRVTE